MENSTDETTLTTTIANNATHGTGGSWSSIVGSTLKVSTDKETMLRGPVSVTGDTSYNDVGSTRCWRSPDNVDNSRIIWSFDSAKSAVVFSGYITIGPTGGNFELYDFIHVRHGGNGSVMQLNTGGPGNPVMQIESYGGATNHSADFAVTQGTTYWYSFKCEASGTDRLVFYEIVGWTQVASVTVAAPSGNIDSAYFGVGSNHGNTSATSTYFDDIVINWTDVTFPFLPDEEGNTLETTNLNATTLRVG